MQWRFLGRTFYLSKTLVVFVAGAVCVGMVAAGYFLLRDSQQAGVVLTANPVSDPATATLIATQATMPATTAPGKAVWEIYIVGAVKNPGIYALEEGALVHDAIEAAGGMLPAVNPATVNMVQSLQNHLMIHILTEKERKAQERDSSLVLVKDNAELSGGQTGPGTTGSGEMEKININTATKEELMTLSGIGEARAESILAYREEHGPFQTIEDIMLVSGIKESAFAKIKDRITT